MSKLNYKKCVTCHAGSRDGYQLSIALDKEGLLDRLITDFYTPDIFSKLLPQRSSMLSSKKVISLRSNVFRLKVLKQPYQITDSILSRYALKRALRSNSNLFLSSYTACEAFEGVKNAGLDIKCLLFQVHPHPSSIKLILDEEIKLIPIARDSIMGELEMSENSSVIDRLIKESSLADGCVVASSYTKETLIENDVPAESIKVVPYGVNASRFPAKKNYDISNGKLKIIFVGQMIQRKGLYYLFEAIRLLKASDIELTIVGRGSIDHVLLAKYTSLIKTNVKIDLSHDDMVKELHQSDVLIFPSLIEGFGHVILEAMSCGIPVICTPNTAGRDLFITGNEGMIVSIRDISALAQKIEWCIDNKKELMEMGKQAAMTARKFTWEKFRNETAGFYIDQITL